MDNLPIDTFIRNNRALRADQFYCVSARPFDSENHMKPIGGFLGFFTEDEKFEKYYTNPAKWLERLVDEQWHAIIEPDFSTYWDWPFALRLWSIYRARWCCRYWQKMGINVIPMLRRSRDVEADAWLYNSLPREVPVMAMQIRMGGTTVQKDPEYWKAIEASIKAAKEHNNVKMILFYGRPSLEKYVIGLLPKGVKYRMVTPFNDARIKHNIEAKGGRYNIEG